MPTVNNTAREMQDGKNVTTFVDVADTTSKTFTFTDAQDSVDVWRRFMRRLINVLKQWLYKPFKSTNQHELTEYEKWCPVCDGAGYEDILPCDTCDGKGYVRMNFREKHGL